LADAAERFGGAEARALVAFTALLTTAATANAVLVVTSRISFAMARDGLLPQETCRSSPSRAPG
jgi:basic amino acid/polyamine antiporter, APA family